MWNKRLPLPLFTPWQRRGFTILEMLVAIVVISVGLAGVMSAFTNSVKGSADPAVRIQLQAIAEQLMEEILLKPYAVTANSAPTKTCGRETYNDVSDFNGYPASASCPISDVDGDPVPNLTGYTVSVSVSAGSLTASGLATVPGKKVTISVKRGNEAFVLVSWRTDYAS
jgi:MSHA pilin protein MshD